MTEQEIQDKTIKIQRFLTFTSNSLNLDNFSIVSALQLILKLQKTNKIYICEQTYQFLFLIALYINQKLYYDEIQYSAENISIITCSKLTGYDVKKLELCLLDLLNYDISQTLEEVEKVYIFLQEPNKKLKKFHLPEKVSSDPVIFKKPVSGLKFFDQNFENKESQEKQQQSSQESYISMSPLKQDTTNNLNEELYGESYEEFKKIDQDIEKMQCNDEVQIQEDMNDSIPKKNQNLIKKISKNSNCSNNNKNLQNSENNICQFKKQHYKSLSPLKVFKSISNQQFDKNNEKSSYSIYQQFTFDFIQKQKEVEKKQFNIIVNSASKSITDINQNSDDDIVQVNSNNSSFLYKENESLEMRKKTGSQQNPKSFNNIRNVNNNNLNIQRLDNCNNNTNNNSKVIINNKYSLSDKKCSIQSSRSNKKRGHFLNTHLLLSNKNSCTPKKTSSNFS